MAVPAGTYRIEVTGTMPGGETFSFGYWSARGGDQGASADTVAADTVADAQFQVFVNTCRQLASPGVEFVAVEVSRYGAGGRADDSATRPLGGSAGPGTGTAVHPNYVALCVTLRNGQAGARNRNRMYLVANGAPLGPEGNLTAGPLTDTADAAQDLLIGGTAQVVSPTYGIRTAVTRVTIDARMDTQRGRIYGVTAATVSRS